MYGVHKVQMSLPGRYVSAGALVLSYGATNVAPTQKDRPLLSWMRRPHVETHQRSWNEHKFFHGLRRGPKPRTTVLARVSRNLLDRAERKVGDSSFPCLSICLSVCVSVHLIFPLAPIWSIGHP
jgi:hypothetical protein